MDAAGGRDPVFPMQPPPLTPYYSSSFSSSSSPASASHHHASLSITNLPVLLLTVLGILTASALLLTYYVFVIRCCLTWHGDSDSSSPSRRRRRHQGGAELPVVHGAPVEARGLEEPAIQALPAFRYRKAVKNSAAVESSGECAVCLGEFQEEERVRLLPSCLHVFHADCIDTWLQGNANCPLCRAAITTTGGQLPLMDQFLRPEEVVIQVQVAGAGEEGNTAVAGSAGDAPLQRG